MTVLRALSGGPLDSGGTLLFRRRVRHLHLLGARAVAEFLEEIARQTGCAATVSLLLAEYEERLTPEMLRCVGGDRFPWCVPLLVPR